MTTAHTPVVTGEKTISLTLKASHYAAIEMALKRNGVREIGVEGFLAKCLAFRCEPASTLDAELAASFVSDIESELYDDHQAVIEGTHPLQESEVSHG